MVNPNRFYTYAYLREDRTPYYIGKGQGKRAYYKYRKGLKPPKDKSRIIFLKQNLTEEEAFKHEIYMIAVFGRKDLGTGILHNRTNGGDGASGAIFSECHKKRISEARKGKKLSDETKEKIRECNKGKKLSDETKKKIGEFHKGKKVSEETKIKMSESQKGRTLTEDHKMKISGEKNGSSKYWKLTFKCGKTIVMCGLSNWCIKNGYSKGNISKVFYGKRKQHKDIVKVEEIC